jgi:nucleoside 2-deoxyribosyltransferase
MKIYLAGKWEERERIGEYAKRLESTGHTITWRWFDHEIPGAVPEQCAVLDKWGVEHADVCIYIFEREKAYKGTYTELGMAIAFNKRMILVGNAADRNVFAHYPLVERVKTFDEAVNCISPKP